MFADNDIRLSVAAVQTLASSLAGRSNAAIAMPRVILTVRPDRIQYEGAYCHWLGHMILRNEDSPLQPSESAPVLVDSMVSACFIVVRSRGRMWCSSIPVINFIMKITMSAYARLAGREIMAVSDAVVMHGRRKAG
jgi:hypothetical protein